VRQLKETVAGSGAILLASAAAMLAYGIGLPTWQIIAVFFLIALGAVLLKIGE